MPAGACEIDHREAGQRIAVFEPLDRHLPPYAALAHETQRGLHFLAGVGEADHGIDRQARIGLQHSLQHVGAGATSAETDTGGLVDLERVAHVSCLQAGVPAGTDGRGRSL